MTDQITSLSTRRAPTTTPHPSSTSSNVALFDIDEIDLEEIPRCSVVETVSLMSAAKVNIVNEPISLPCA